MRGGGGRALLRPGVATALPCSRLAGWRVGQPSWLYDVGETTRPSNKGMKLTKPSILELRSLSLVFGGPGKREANMRTRVIP